MSKRFENKTAIVTGGSSGIGRAVALKLAEGGAKVIIVSRHANALQAVCDKSDNISYVAADLTDTEDVAKVAEAASERFCGKLDILVNNAGITKDGLMMRMTEAQWDAVINVNLKSAFNFINATLPIMMRQRSGSIINMASVVGVHGNAGQSNYAASKAGLIALAKSIAQEVGSRGIRANAIAPGFIETAMTAALPEDAVSYTHLTLPTN